jgi:hypothetical protein
VETPVTVWTWLKCPASIRLETEDNPAGQRFVELLIAPSGHHRAFHKYGRKAVSWGRMDELPEMFCIITRKFVLLKSQILTNGRRMGLPALMGTIPR